MIKELKFALLGFGGIAQSHKHGYDILKNEGFPIKLVAICDIDKTRFHSAQKINLGSVERGDLSDISLYTDLESMLESEEIDVVDICLPTYLHKEYAIKLMRAGKHVLSEKPMSLSHKDCEEMIAVSKECDRKLMIGQCLHFHESYDFLKKSVDNQQFGKLHSISLERLSILPAWGFEGWYRDVSKSGGAPFDLHIHDIDMVNYILGMPNSLSSVILDGEMPRQYVNTRLFYDDVTAFVTASFNEAATVNFKMAFRARFENASLICEGGCVTVYPNDSDAAPYVAVGTADGERKDYMAEEIRAMARYVAEPDFVNTVNPPECASGSIKLIENILISASEDGKKIIIKEN